MRRPGPRSRSCAPGEADDRRLAAAAARGDPAAFEALYRRHGAWAVTVARRFTGSTAEALDVRQEAFAHLLAQGPGFELTRSVRAFLYPVIRHRALSTLRRRRRVVALGPEGPDGVAAPGGPGEAAGDFDRLVRTLPRGQRDVLRLRFVQGLRLGEIAAALDVPLGTVKSRLHGALYALRAQVDATAA